METYPYESIRINGKDVLIQHIVSETAAPQSEFEASTFSFIHDWFRGTSEFTQLTSGSTGHPKEITITRAGMIASADLTKQALALQPGWCALVCVHTSYIAGKMMLVRSFVTGMKIIAVEPSGNPFLGLPHDQTVDFTALVPLQVNEIIRSQEAGWFNRINAVLIGGAAIDAETVEKLQQFQCQFYATYGMTETLSHIALMPLNGTKPSEYFTVLAGITIGLDERGCLTIHASHLHEPITTNDLVELIDKSNFKWLGRWDNVINSGGIKVIPEKLESEIAIILNSLGVHQKFLVGSVHDEKFGNKVILLIEYDVSQPVMDQIHEEMLKKIQKREVPKHIYSGKPFVLTESGKIDRNATIMYVTTTNNY